MPTSTTPSLHEKLRGAKSGESVTADVVFPDDHPEPKRAGKAFSVQMEKIEVKEKVLPALDDELAKDLGQFENLAELRDQVRQQAEAETRQEADQDLRNHLLEKLLEANPFEAPETLVEHELDQRIEEMAGSLVDRGVDPARAKIDWRELREGQRDAAARSVGATILLDRIVEQENLKETEGAIEKEIQRGASAIKKSPQVVRAQLMKEGGLERLKRRLRRELAVDLLRENARIKMG